MNIQTLTSPKSYKNNNNNNVCPSDDAGLLRYSSSSPPTMRFINNKPADDTKQSYHMYSPSNQQQQQHQSYHYNHPPQQHHHHQQQQQQQQQHQYYYPPQPPQQLQQSNNNIDLQTVVSKYHANPELLKLILASKVEEDKRRTEEARLRAKELDLYLQNQQELKETTSKTSRNSLQLLQDDNTRRRSSGSSTSSTGSFNNNRRFAPYPLARSAVNCNNNGSMGIPLRRNSSISSSPLLSMNQLSIQSSNTSSPSIPVQQQQQKIVMLSSSAPSSTNQYIYPLPLNSYSSSNNRPSSADRTPSINNKPASRRRRSMQAITKIVETNECPYDDHYFWKNNGNTVQKKTGCKSIYYKCANSCKGCPVNKTVVEQPDGNYLIKYRGDHLPECSQVEHIKDL